MTAISATDTGLPDATAATDPLVALVDRWNTVFQKWDEETLKVGAGDADTPECLRLEALRDDLTEQIETAKPASIEGVRALLDFAMNCDGGYDGDGYVSVKKRIVQNVMEYLA